MVAVFATMRQYLCEGATGGFDFIVDRTKPFITESSASGGGTITRIPGRFSVCDCVNGNNRRYSKRVWEKNLNTGSILQESIKRNGAFGLLEHPKDGIVTLNSPISHQVTKASLQDGRDVAGKQVCEVVGEISLYDFGVVHTPEARKLRALIEGGYNPLVSSRGYGSLKRTGDGVDDVEDDYVCEGWDVVIKPSFENAELNPDRSALSQPNAHMAQPAGPNPAAESLAEAEVDKKARKCFICSKKHTNFPSKYCPDCEVNHAKAAEDYDAKKHAPTDENLKESKPSSGSTPAASLPPTNTKRMELKDIKSRIAMIESLDTSKLNPHRFAESVTQVEELHQQIAECAAGDPKLSWEAQKMHNALDRVSARLSETVKAPTVKAQKLAENNVKLMKVVNAVASTALTYKKRLGESAKAKGVQTKLVEELTRRGQGWQKLAEQRKEKFVQLQEDFDTSCEALDIMAKRYHEDTTELARRLIVLEFKEKAQTPSIQKALKEASRLRHIAAIRESLEVKPSKVNEEGDKKAGVGKPADGETVTMAKKPGDKKGVKGEVVAEEPGKVTNESQQGPRIVLRESVDPRGLTESVEMVKRLSKAIA